MKAKIKKLSSRDKVIVALWVLLFVALSINSFLLPREELEENCAEFVSKNGCYMSEDEMRELSSGRRLFELVEGTPFDSPREACGCITYNITDL